MEKNVKWPRSSETCRNLEKSLLQCLELEWSSPRVVHNQIMSLHSRLILPRSFCFSLLFHNTDDQFKAPIVNLDQMHSQSFCQVTLSEEQFVSLMSIHSHSSFCAQTMSCFDATVHNGVEKKALNVLVWCFLIASILIKLYLHVNETTSHQRKLLSIKTDHINETRLYSAPIKGINMTEIKTDTM